jgi:hypothetical protein
MLGRLRGRAFSNLEQQMQLARHLARRPAGLAVRIAQRILALTLDILLNPTQRPPDARPRRLRTAAESHRASSCYGSVNATCIA